VAQNLSARIGLRRLRSIAVCPGFISTSILATIPEKVIKALEDKVPMGRLGKPEDVANTFAFLASDDAEYINGAVIEVSGGLVI
jgi:3-oxoacyl-[acyl-carrier protein] reductase